MAGAAPVATLHRVHLALVIRHLTGCPESAHDRVGARHRRVLQLYCAGWSGRGRFACLIRDPEGDAAFQWFGAGPQPDCPDLLRSIRLRALRRPPDAVWHHPYPLESASDYEAQDAVLRRHLAEHAAQAGWTDDPGDTLPAVGADGDAGVPPTAPARLLCPQPPLLQEGPAQRLWAPDPDAPPARIRVFPGFVDYRGRRFRVTGRDRPDPSDDALTMEYRADDAASPALLWLSEGGRVARQSDR
ncbi:hypothetical protein [Aquisalimonas asiatica]|uniref:Uncharacterized protein n=1 Tax=Aquisalimonas asiatica TaxID=406100 RepID=A0A1H8TBL1_9GAMM|nr:hypothetical protein [Aquisalimonas asiatica]SEO88529.1 hypothetical protein SAMN04488052_10452 [Aquisalimonas asiatica]